jgi:hypothetical protein
MTGVTTTAPEYLCHALPVVEDALPDPAAKSTPRMPERVCCIVVGNHDSYVGIVEMVHALHSYFSRHFTTLVSKSLVPGAINVLIDEFSKQYLIRMMQEVRSADPKTRFIIMATEFVTRMSPLGIFLGNTFNHFNTAEDYRDPLRHLGYTLGLRRTPPYYEARYQGFVAALSSVDLVLCAHPAVAGTMSLLSADVRRAMPVPLTLYPELDVARVATDQRLHLRPTGVVMTGTLTKFRQRVARDMIKAFRHAQVTSAFYLHRPFDPSDGISFGEHGVDLGYTRDRVIGTPKPDAYLYNLNPPQRPTWGYSSPMRLQRAILLGQIPLITRRFYDHPIEEVAHQWDGTPRTAEKIWVEASASRFSLVERHIAAVARYDSIAKQQNAAIDAALAEIA